MTRILQIFFGTLAILLLGPSIISAQNTKTTDLEPGNYGFADNQTKNPEINAQWKKGDYPYPARPKDMWELGVNIGHSFVSGDVETELPASLGVGIHVRKAVNYLFSVRAGINYYSARGLDARPTSLSVFKREKTYSQNNLGARLGDVRTIHRNYKTKIWGGSIEGVLNIGNLLFHSPEPKWGLNMALGLGINAPQTTINIFDGNSNYNWSSATQGLDMSKKEDRKTARQNLRDMLDDSWETDGGEENTIRALGDDKTIYPTLKGGFGVTRKINDRFNIGLQHEIVFADNDLLDGFEYRTAVDRSANIDMLHYTSVTINFNLGSFNNRTQPLYWVNPMAPVMMDLAEVKSRPELDLTDTDGDGVIDMLDQEPDTPVGAPVDVRGVALDSDQDGVPDYMDKEPFSKPGFDVDADGVAIVPDQGYLTEDEINTLVNNKMSNLRMDWWLPMIHFDLNKYYVKPAYYGALLQVATVMKNQPDLKVVVQGYTDNRGSADYNRVLSYNRSKAVVDYLVDRYDIARERLIIQYGGEKNELVPELQDNYALDKREEMQQYLNRRVEFYVARPGDEPMEKPEGPEAGEGTPGSSRSGTKYSGNKNSGY
ncbi:OmpA family protein [Membranicola marinus]|uniref:OmpA family protein n=1 Tax=Membranihabitans marinus TaxID=1227546 RepID=A0A953L6P6_9BACT|nr:OmpA family protein [Membranihabitans marinus]MBY5957882.1 OmpA family protein [Membranihabitans marinus]